MYPVLFHAFGVPIYSYAALMVAGYLVALGLLFWVSPKQAAPDTGGLERPQVWDLFIVMVVSSIIGSKVGHVLFEAEAHEGVDSLWELMQKDPWHVLRLGEAGYVWYGGMIAALLTAVVYFRRRPRLDAWQYSDAFAPAIMAGAAVGRLGCFLAGCCYGQPTDTAWGVWFPQLSGPVHPTQLYDSFAAGSIAVVLLWRYHRRRFVGENIALLLMLYPVARATTEIFRGDPERGALGPLSTSQLLSIPLFAVGVWFYLTRSRETAARPTPPPS